MRSVRNPYIAMLKAYFDESAYGPMVSVCGFIAREDQWQEVTSECREAFDLFRMPYLHMSEFARPDAPSYSQLPYEDRFPAMETIMGIVRRNVPLAISVSLDDKSFESATSQRFRSQIGSAYTICATTAVLLVGQLLREEDIDWNVIWTFEHGHANSVQLSSRLAVLHESVGRAFRIQQFGFSPKAPEIIPEIPLQIADALAYAKLQPQGSFRVLDLLCARNNGDILCDYDVELTPALVHQAWGPLAEIEAYGRKMRKLASKGMTITKKYSQLYPEGSAHEVDEDERHDMEKAVAKLNKIAKMLGIDARVRITDTNLDVS